MRNDSSALEVTEEKELVYHASQNRKYDGRQKGERIPSKGQGIATTQEGDRIPDKAQGAAADSPKPDGEQQICDCCHSRPAQVSELARRRTQRHESYRRGDADAMGAAHNFLAAQNLPAEKGGPAGRDRGEPRRLGIDRGQQYGPRIIPKSADSLGGADWPGREGAYPSPSAPAPGGAGATTAATGGDDATHGPWPKHRADSTTGWGATTADPDLDESEADSSAGADARAGTGSRREPTDTDETAKEP